MGRAVSRLVTDTGAWFTATADGLVPAPEAASPWAPDMLHGRLLAGLAARAVEPDGVEYRVARLTVDLFRFPPMQPVTVTTSVARDGRRVRAVDVSLHIAGNEVARARAAVLRVTDGVDREVTAWQPPEWDAPAPDEVAPGDGPGIGGWDVRPINRGGFFSDERKQLWSRDRWPLVAGEVTTPLVRAALAADLPNPLANADRRGLRFINGDLTLYLARYPVSDWIGLQVIEHLHADGIAVGACRLYDTRGAIGWSSVSAVTNDPLAV
jgi:hypothetical protein